VKRIVYKENTDKTRTLSYSFIFLCILIILNLVYIIYTLIYPTVNLNTINMPIPYVKEATIFNFITLLSKYNSLIERGILQQCFDTKNDSMKLLQDIIILEYSLYITTIYSTSIQDINDNIELLRDKSEHDMKIKFGTDEKYYSNMCNYLKDNFKQKVLFVFDNSETRRTSLILNFTTISETNTSVNQDYFHQYNSFIQYFVKLLSTYNICNQLENILSGIIKHLPVSKSI
jgi:hypothetical protein